MSNTAINLNTITSNTLMASTLSQVAYNCERCRHPKPVALKTSHAHGATPPSDGQANVNRSQIPIKP